MKNYLIAVLLGLSGLAVIWWFSAPLQVSQQTAAPEIAPPVVQPVIAQPAVITEQPAAEAEVDETRDISELDPDAIASLQQAREQGDERAPQIHSSTPRQAPAADVIADEIAYADYQTTQQKKMYRAYVEAAKDKVALLNRYIAKAKQQGDIAPDEIAAAEEKVRGIEEMAARLQRENPDLMLPEFAADAP